MADPAVLFTRPDNWDEMTDEEQTEFSLGIAEALGFTDDEDENDLTASAQGVEEFYSPNQPRRGKGPGGGRWIKGGQGMLPGTEHIKDVTPEAHTAGAIEDYFDNPTPEGGAKVKAGVAARVNPVLAERDLEIDPNVSTITATTDEIEVRLVFREIGSPFHVGQMHRRITPDTVYNEEFGLLPPYQNRGIATDLAGSLESWYSDNGIYSVRVHANADIGGYAWAAQGFDWDGLSGPEEFLDRVVDHIGDVPSETPNLAAIYRRGAYSAGELGIEPSDVMDELRSVGDSEVIGRLIERGEYEFHGKGGYYGDVHGWFDEVLDAGIYDEKDPRMSEVVGLRSSMKFGDLPTPYDISQIGRGSGDASWPGKEAMLNSDWHGVKHI